MNEINAIQAEAISNAADEQIVRMAVKADATTSFGQAVMTEVIVRGLQLLVSRQSTKRLDPPVTSSRA